MRPAGEHAALLGTHRPGQPGRARRLERAPALPPEDVATLETLGNLRAVGLSIEDMRAYLASARRGDEAAGEQRALFEAHARRLADEVAALELRRRYLDLKVRYWSAREAGDLDKAAAVAEELAPIIRRMNPKDNA